MLRIRKANKKDIEEIMNVENSEYGKINWTAPKEVFNYRYDNCFFKDKGDLFWVAEENKKIVGYITSLIINFDPAFPPKTREEAMGYHIARDGKTYGFGTKHTKNGNALYVMSIGVSDKGKGIAAKLVDKTINFVKKENLQYRVAGLRSWYHTYKIGDPDSKYKEFRNPHPEITPEDYTNIKRENGEFIDPLMRLYSRGGFRHLKLKENYAIEDSKGAGFGELMIWNNQNYKLKGKRKNEK